MTMPSHVCSAALVAQDRLSSLALPPCCMSWGEWLTLTIQPDHISAHFLHTWNKQMTVTPRPPFRAPSGILGDVREACRRDLCCQLPGSFLQSVGFLHVSEIWSPRSSGCLSPSLCRPSVAPLSILTSLPSPDTALSWDNVLVLD